jgi:hypothetical protein
VFLFLDVTDRTFGSAHFHCSIFSSIALIIVDDNEDIDDSDIEEQTMIFYCIIVHYIN